MHNLKAFEGKQNATLIPVLGLLYLLSSELSGERQLQPFSGRRGRVGRKFLLRGRGVHCGEDPDDFCSLSGGDVLGHVDDGIHGNLWVGLDQAGEEDVGE